MRANEYPVLARALDPNWMARFPNCKSFVAALREAVQKPRQPTQKFGSATYFFRRDLLWSALGLTAMGIAMRTDFGFYRRWSYALLIASIGMLAAVLVVGARINGARRWFHFAGVSFQPAELAKLALMIYLASSLAKKAEKVKSFTVGFVPQDPLGSLDVLQRPLAEIAQLPARRRLFFEDLRNSARDEGLTSAGSLADVYVKAMSA